MISDGISPNEYRFFSITREGKLTIFNLYFESLSELELFCRSNPTLNTRVFYSPASTTGTEYFAGPPLETAIDYLLGGYTDNYYLFLKLTRQLQSINAKSFSSARVEPSFVGHRPNIPAYLADAPKNMYRSKRISEKKLINVFLQITYDQHTSEAQILHRGILALNLIKLLELNGYIVRFRVFEVSYINNEVFICEVVLKQTSENLDPHKCYYPMCGKGFVRRILLRIKESIPFKENWNLGYGNVAPEVYTRQFMNIGSNDIYIGTPKELGIKGVNLYEDADTFIKKLGLEGRIIVPNYSMNSTYEPTDEEDKN